MNRSNLTQDEALRDQWFEEAEQAAGIRFDDDAEGEES